MTCISNRIPSSASTQHEKKPFQTHESGCQMNWMKTHGFIDIMEIKRIWRRIHSRPLTKHERQNPSRCMTPHIKWTEWLRIRFIVILEIDVHFKSNTFQKHDSTWKTKRFNVKDPNRIPSRALNQHETHNPSRCMTPHVTWTEWNTMEV